MEWFLFFVYLLGYAICSGANVGFFAFSQRELRRQIAFGAKLGATEAEQRIARRAQAIRSHLRDPNWTLAAILLANVGFGVQLSQLCDSLFVGLLAVVVPVLAITVFGEFFSQATYLRFTGPLCAWTSPIILVLKWVTSPVSWPLARGVDALLGREAFGRLNEQDLIADLELELRDVHDTRESTHSERLDPREIRILMNVARADDELARDLGKEIDPSSIILVPFRDGQPVLAEDSGAFARETLGRAHHPWFVLADREGQQRPRLLDADGFVRDWLNAPDAFEPANHVYLPKVFVDPQIRLGAVVDQLVVLKESRDDDVIDLDVVLIWSEEGRWILTGGDILGRFLRGVPRKLHWRTAHRIRRSSHSKTS